MSVLIKGYGVKFERTAGKAIVLPYRYGIIHDPEGTILPPCNVYFGPYTISKRVVEAPSRAAREYFGRDYKLRYITVAIPSGTWKPVGEVAVLHYVRTEGSAHGGPYFHPIKQPLNPSAPLTKNGRFYKIAMPDGCVINWRGFVFP